MRKIFLLLLCAISMCMYAGDAVAQVKKKLSTTRLPQKKADGGPTQKILKKDSIPPKAFVEKPLDAKALAKQHEFLTGNLQRTKKSAGPNISARPIIPYEDSVPLDSACSNFESDAVGIAPSADEWDGWYGRKYPYSTLDPGHNEILINLQQGLFPGAPSDWDTSLLLQSRQRIMSNSYDSIVETFGGTNHLSKVHSGTKSVRLGNSVINFGIEAMQKTFKVTRNNFLYTFWYALVMNRPIHDSVVPKASPYDTENPFFLVKLYDSNGVYLPGAVRLMNNTDILSSLNPLFRKSPNWQNVFWDWTKAQVNLEKYIGSTVTLELINSDCAQGGHFGYTYLDDFCGTSHSVSDTTNPTGSLGSISVAANGICSVNVTVNYSLPFKPDNTKGKMLLDIEIYHDGDTIGVIHTDTLSSGTQYSTTITPGMLSGFGGYADIRVVAYPFIDGVAYGPIVSNLKEGLDSGINNDFKICCLIDSLGTDSSYKVSCAGSLPASFVLHADSLAGYTGKWSIESFTTIHARNDTLFPVINDTLAYNTSVTFSQYGYAVVKWEAVNDSSYCQHIFYDTIAVLPAAHINDSSTILIYGTEDSTRINFTEAIGGNGSWTMLSSPDNSVPPRIISLTDTSIVIKDFIDSGTYVFEYRIRDFFSQCYTNTIVTVIYTSNENPCCKPGIVRHHEFTKPESSSTE